MLQCCPNGSRQRGGLDSRIGLEDVLIGPGGEPISGNPYLVDFAIHQQGV